MLNAIRAKIADFISPENMERRNAAIRAANYDALTNLANRRAYDLALPAAEADPNIAIVIFDANNFGQLNKIAGHKFGDIALKDMAGILVATAEVYGIAERNFRIGGDEFAAFIRKDLAAPFRDQVEAAYGVRFPAVGGVQLVGSIGSNYDAAEAGLQKRKTEKKQWNITNTRPTITISGS